MRFEMTVVVNWTGVAENRSRGPRRNPTPLRLGQGPAVDVDPLRNLVIWRGGDVEIDLLILDVGIG